jgi:hypothetical protein
VELYPIMATGIRAFCSDLIIDPYSLEEIYFMSVCGYQTTVKGITANLFENYGVSVEINGDEYYLTRIKAGYKTKLKKLPSGFAHAIVFPKLALPKNVEDEQNSFCIFTNCGNSGNGGNGGKGGNGGNGQGDKMNQDRLNLFFRHLDEKVDIPLHPSWSALLWEMFSEQDDWLLELKTLAGSYKGYLFKFNPKHLHDMVSDAIRSRKPEIISCMQWKGGNGNGRLN